MSRQAVHRFESLDALVKAGEKGSGSSRTVDTSSNPWSGTSTYDEALSLARDGWAEMRPMVEKIADKVRPHLAEFEQDTVTWSYDVVGETPDIGRFLTGEPECMMMPIHQPIARHGRVVTILVDMCASASINPQQIQARGAAIVALIETLQIIGHTVELWAEVSTKSAGKGDVVTTLVKIKSPSEYIDDDHLMYVLAHPSLLRRHCFAQWETPKHAWERFASEGDRGTPKPATQGEAIGADVIVHGPQHGDPVITSPAEWVKMALKSLGLWEED